MDQTETIKQLIKQKGPVIPSQITKELRTSLLLAGAMLSELVEKKILKVSNTKIGSSPVYFLPGQEGLLQTLYSKLSEKDKRTYDLLKSKKVLRDRAQDTLVRVSLRKIKDFAYPLEVKTQNGSEIFWKWYMLPNQEANSFISNILESSERKAQQEINNNNNNNKNINNQNIEANAAGAAQQNQQTNINNIKHIQNTALSQNANDVNAAATQSTINNFSNQGGQQVSTTQQGQQNIQQPGSQINNTDQTVIQNQNNQKQTQQKQKINEKQIIKDVKEKIKKEKKKDNVLKKIVDTLKGKKETQKKLSQEESEKDPLKDMHVDDEFLTQLKKIFVKSNIEIRELEIIRKNSDIEFILEVPSAVGTIKYFCKAKNKKKCNDGDLSSVFLKAQLKKLPALFMTTGDITKKAELMLEKEFSGMIIKKI